MPIPVLGKLIKGFVGTDGLVDAVNVEEDTNRFFLTAAERDQIRNSQSGHTDPLLATLLGGATQETVAGSNQLIYAPDFSLGADYRDNAQGSVNDATHFIDAAVSVVGTHASNEFTFPAGTSFQRLLAIRFSLNTGSMATGGMIVLSQPGGQEEVLLDITTDKKMEIDRNPAGVANTTIISDLNGEVVIDDGTWVLFQFVPTLANDDPLTTTSWDLIATVLKADGSVLECNNITLDLSNLNLRVLGLSRSTVQRGEIDQFKFISHPSYISHSNLASLLQNHINDHWIFGYGRLVLGTDREAVVLSNSVELEGPIKSTINRANVHQSVNTTTGAGGLVDEVILPSNYFDFDFVYVEILDSGKFATAMISTTLLSQTLYTFGDEIFVDDKNVVTWTVGTRAIGSVSQNISSVFLVAH